MTTTHVVNYGQHDSIKVVAKLNPSHGHHVHITQGEDPQLMPMPEWEAAELAHAILAAIEDIARDRKRRAR